MPRLAEIKRMSDDELLSFANGKGSLSDTSLREISDDELLSLANDSGAATSPVKAEAVQPPPQKASVGGVVSAAAQGVAEGLSTELPGMVGGAMEYAGRYLPGELVSNVGRDLKDWAEKKKKQMFGPEKKREGVERWVYEGSKMLAPSLVPAGLIGTGVRLLTGVGRLVKAGKAAQAAGDMARAEELFTAANSAARQANNIASASTAVMFGGSQAQQTIDTAEKQAKKLEAAGDTEGARKVREVAGKAALATGAIEAGGEFLGTKYLGKLFRLDEAGVAKRGGKELVKDFLKTMGVEVSTEMGQQGGEAAVEKYSVIRPEADPLEEALDVIGPTAFMTLITGGAAGGINAMRRPEDPVDLLQEAGQGEQPDLTEPIRAAIEKQKKGESKPQLGIAVPEHKLALPAGQGFELVGQPYGDFRPEQSRGEGGYEYMGEGAPESLDVLPKENQPAPDLEGLGYEVNAVRPRPVLGEKSEPAPAPEPEVSQIEQIDQAANEAATSPLNDLAQPTEGQKDAGNYKKGHVKVHGLDISIENPKTSERSGVGADGKPWSVVMQHPYGYIKGTQGKDKDHIDVIIGPDPESDKAFIVDQVDPKTGKFDEHKTLIGFTSEEEARKGYLENYEEGWKGLGAITEMPVDKFKKWVKSGRKVKPVAYKEESHAESISGNEGQVLLGGKGKLEKAQPGQVTLGAKETGAVRLGAGEGGENIQQQKPEQSGGAGQGLNVFQKMPDAELEKQAKAGVQGAKDELAARKKKGAGQTVATAQTGKIKPTTTAKVDLPKGWTAEIGRTRTKEGETAEAEVDWRGKRLVFSEQKHMDNPEIWNHEIAHVVVEELPARDDLFKDYIEAKKEDWKNEGYDPEWIVKNQFHREEIAMEYGDYLNNPKSVKPELVKVFEKHLGKKEVPQPAPSEKGEAKRAARKARAAEKKAVPAPPEKKSKRQERKAEKQQAKQEQQLAQTKEAKPENPAPEQATKPDPETQDRIQKLENQIEELTKKVSETKEPETAVAAETKPEVNTEDAGEELAANKRNRFKSGLKWDDIAGENTALKVKEAVKSNVYPKPDYGKMIEDGMEPMIAHLAKQIYDSISVSPITAAAPADADLKLYIEAVNRVMDGAIAWASSNESVAKWAQSQVGVASAMAGKPVSITEMAKASQGLLDSVYPDGWKNHKDELRIIGGNKVLRALQPGYDEGKRAMKAIQEGWPGKQESWQKQGYSVSEKEKVTTVSKGYQYDPETNEKTDVYFVRVKNRTHGEGYPTKQEAEAVIAEFKPWLFLDKFGRIKGQFDTQEQATEQARAAVKRESKDQISEKGISVELAERIGPARRMEGEDITSDRLQETFGFKGVNFGNWMKGESNKAERQLHLNHAYDSFMDLAEILGVPPEAMSLNGMLGLAIGAQGTGKHAAHFVPGVNEINLTRTAGAGALTHEFGHALDHHFARQAGLEGSKEPYLTENVGLVDSEGYRKHLGKKIKAFENIRPEIVAHFKNIVATMTKKQASQEQTAATAQATKDRAKRSVEGWLKSIRNSFAGVEADFDKLADRIMNLDLGEGKISLGGSTYISPVVSEIRDLYKKKNGRVYSLENIKALQSNIDFYAHMNSEKAAEREHVPQMVSTDYAKEAKSLDKNKGGRKYWSTNVEMFARAFDAFITDTLEERAAKNSYLAGIESAPPKGEERTAINAAFDRLVKEIKTRETGVGAEMYSVKEDADFSRQVDDFVAGKILPGHVLTVSSTPAVLEMLKAEQLPIIITYGNMEKMIDRKHGLDPELMKQLPAQLADPVMVFESATQPDSLVVMTELKKEGKTVVAAIRLSRTVSHHEVNEVVSIHPRESDAHFFNWINQGLLLYQEKQKSREWFLSRGLQSPKEETAIRGFKDRRRLMTAGLQLPLVRGAAQSSGRKILFKHDLVKWVNERGEKLSIQGGEFQQPTLADVQEIFKGQDVKQTQDGTFLIKTRGGEYLAIFSVDQVDADSLAFNIGYGRNLTRNDIIAGSYKDGVIRLSKTEGDKFTLAHESAHFIEETGLIDVNDTAILSRHIKRLVRKGEFETANRQDIGGKEDRANFLADQLVNKNQPKGAVGRIIFRVKNFIDRLVNAFGIRTAGGVVRDVKSGKIFGKELSQTPDSDSEVYMTSKKGAGDITTEKTPKPEGGKRIFEIVPKTFIELPDNPDAKIFRISDGWSYAVEFIANNEQAFLRNISDALIKFKSHEKHIEKFTEPYLQVKIRENDWASPNYPQSNTERKIGNISEYGKLYDDAVKSYYKADYMESQLNDIESWLARSDRKNIKLVKTDLPKPSRPPGSGGQEQYSVRTQTAQPKPAETKERKPLQESSDIPGMLKRSWDEFRFQAQDKFHYLNKAQIDAARRSRSELPEEQDAYLAETRYHGMAAAAIDDFDERFVTPLLEVMSRNNIEVEQVDEYLHARHAREANERLQRLNPEREDNEALSGMSNEEADLILNRIRRGTQGNAYRTIGEMVDTITKARRDLLVEAGLELPETIQAWEDAYQYYVPLMREGHGDAMPRKGKGFEVRGGQKVRGGSTSEVVNILANVVAQHEATIVRAEKAKVSRAFLEFAKNNPGPWKIDTPERVATYDSNGLISYRANPLGFILADNVLAVRVDGVDHHITFDQTNLEAMRIASAMKNLDAADMGSLVRVVSKISRWLAMINTSLNPEFIISNFARDLQTAAYNMSDSEADRIRMKAIKQVGSAFKGIRDFQGNRGTEWADWFNRFRNAGGQTGWLQAYDDIRDREKDLINKLENMKPGKIRTIKRGMQGAFDYIADMNTAVENAIRLSVFKNLIEAGVAESRAAQIAKELTVNFNRRGNMGPVINAFYLFYNASIQGSARLITAAATNKKVRKLMVATVIFAAQLDVFNRMMGSGDDPDDNLYDKIPPWVKSRNLIIMLPGERGYLQIPLPWGYNVFHVIGQAAGEILSKKNNKATDSVLRVAGATISSFNPVGGESSILQILSPTLTDPFVQWAENKDWSGKPLRPAANVFAKRPSSQTYWSSVREPSKWIANQLNTLTGGDEIRPGKIDISPEAIDLAIDTLTGGAGKFVGNLISSPIKAAKGEDLETYEIPVLRKVYGKPGKQQLTQEYYENMDAVRLVDRQIKHYENDPEKIKEIVKDYRPEVRLIGMMKATQETMKELRDRLKVVDKMKDPEIKADRKKKIEATMEKVMTNFNKKYNAMKGKGK